MKNSRWLLGGLTALALAGGLLTYGSTTAAPATLQINPVPQDCACSAGIDVGAPKDRVLLKHCTCGQLQCAVLADAGQLYCTR
jgi:hypothetical protein